MLRPFFLLALTALLVLGGPARAQTCDTSWISPGGGLWENEGNWDDGVPGATDTACITLDGTYTVIAGTADRVVGALVLGGASGTQTLTTQSKFTVAGDAFVRPNGRWEIHDRVPGGTDGLYTGGTVLVEGTLVQNGGTTLIPSNGGVLDVAPGGRYELTGGAGAGGASSLFRIRGTAESTGTFTCTIDAPLEVDGGTIRSAGGRLDVRAGGTMHDATLDAAAGSILYLVGSTPFTFTGTTSGTPAGTVQVFSVPIEAGPGDATLALGGTGLQMFSSSGLDFTSLTSAGGRFINTGLVTTRLFIGGVSGDTVIENRGTLRVESLTLQDAGSVIENEAGGTIEFTSSGVGGSGRIVNRGLMLDASDAFAISINVRTDVDGGTVRATGAGRLDLNGGGVLNNATLDATTGATVHLDGSNPYVITGTLSGEPVGTVSMRDAPVSAGPGDATLAFGGTGLDMTATSLTSTGGRFINTGLLISTSGAGGVLGATTIENRGTFRVLSLSLRDADSTIENEAGATIELPGPSGIGVSGRIENDGLIVKTAGTGTFTLVPAIEHRTGAEIRADVGTLSLPSLTDGVGARYTGNGTITPPTGFVTAGIIAPGTSPGLLTWGRSLAVTSTFVLDTELAGLNPGTDYDRLNLNADAALGGTLRLTFDGGFTPALGDAFTVLTTTGSGNNVTGTFANVVAPAGYAFDVTYNPQSVVATVTAVGGGCEQSLTATVSDDTPAPGQQITFTVTVTNNDDAPAPIDLWLEAFRNENQVQRKRLGSGTLPPGASVTRSVPVRIPGSAPAGAYDVDLIIGDFGADEACDVVSFVLTVGGAAGREAAAASAVAVFEVEEAVTFGVEAAASASAGVALPASYALHAAAPNPFAGRTTLGYDLPEAGAVRLVVYDLLGREVARPVDGEVGAGRHAVVLDGAGLAAGVYVVRLMVGPRAFTQRVTVVR